MEVNEHKGWYSFDVPVPQKEDSEDEFLGRAMNCLEAFFQKYTMIPEDKWEKENPLMHGHYGKSGLDKLKCEDGTFSFEDFKVRGIQECNVGFYVGTPEDNYGTIGIHVLTNANDIWQKAKMNLLKEMWRDLDYSFDD